MFIFRIEHEENGSGPLAGSDFITATVFSKCINLHLSPRFFKQMGFDFDLSDNHVFGWSDMTAMKCFFKKDKKKYLHGSPFIVAVYEIADNNINAIKFPDGQVAFYKRDAVLVEKIKIRNINMVKKYDK